MLTSANRMLKRFSIAFLPFVFTIVLCAITAPAYATPTDNGIPEDYKPDIYNSIPAQQFKDVFEEERIEVSGIKVIPDRVSSWDQMVHFRIFNSTTQETEYQVDTVSQDGELFLPTLSLKKNHNYIFFVEDENYQLGTKRYAQILDGTKLPATDGPGAYDIKTDSLTYDRLTEINVYRRDTPCADPFDDNRYSCANSKMPVYVRDKNGNPVAGVQFRLVSDLETLNVQSLDDGKLDARLIEDVTYMVYLEGDDYAIDPFPIVAKDKSEYHEGRYCYNHTTCVRVTEITLYDKGEQQFGTTERTLEVTSLKGRTTVSGMNFKDLLVLDRVLDQTVDALDGREYDVVGITAVNPHRWEISKLVGTDFGINQKIRNNCHVTHVYRLENGSLKEAPFEEANGTVRFKTDSLSVYPFVIEYANLITVEPTVTLEKSSYTYTGRNITPTVVVKNGTTVLTADDYDISLPAERKKVGTYTLTVTLKGAYQGSASIDFSINPKGTSLKKLRPAKKRAKAVWKKQATQTTGYQLQYSTSKSFKKAVKTLTVKGPRKFTCTIKPLKSGKRYYVRIRTYKKVGSTTYWSTWSKAKTVKAK